MKVWILKRTEDIDYDEVGGFIVFAKTEKQARTIAAGKCGDEGTLAWLDSNRSSCEILNPRYKQSRVILSSFNAG